MSHEDLVVEGSRVLNEAALYEDVEDVLTISYYKSAISDGLDGLDFRYIYFKDATASGLQVLGVVLGCRNFSIAERLNLKSTEH